MKHPHARLFKNCCQRAFTLVEVVASLMLLGTLLVGILTAHRRHVEQIRNAKTRLAAIAVAENLLEQWRKEGTWGAVARGGTIKGSSEFAWRWTVTTPPELQQLGATKGRLEIVRAGAVNDVPLVAVELVTGGVAVVPGKGM